MNRGEQQCHFDTFFFQKNTQWPTQFWWLSDPTTGGWVIPIFSPGLYRSYHSKPQSTSFWYIFIPLHSIKTLNDQLNSGGWVIPTFLLGSYRSYHSKLLTTSFRYIFIPLHSIKTLNDQLHSGGWVIPTFSPGLYRSYHSKPQSTSFRYIFIPLHSTKTLNDQPHSGGWVIRRLVAEWSLHFCWDRIEATIRSHRQCHFETFPRFRIFRRTFFVNKS